MHKVAVIQARMGSSRLPGKVLKLLAGKPVLEHVFTRVSAAKLIDDVIVATSELSGDDAIVEFCTKMGWKFIRGSERDVLSRYCLAAEASRADVVVRVTSDCPLFSPIILDDMLERFDPEVADYMSTNWPDRTFPVGLDCEVMSAAALRKIEANATEVYDREHVTPHFYRNPDDFRLLGHAHASRLDHIRITLDTQQDYDRLIGLLAKYPKLALPHTDVINTILA